MSNKYNFADSLSRPSIGRTAFDLSESKVFDTDVGTLNVGYYRYVNPGDKFQISQKMIVRLNPLVNPAYVRMYAVCHYYFIPFRQIWPDWENFLTRGVSGNDDLEIPRMYNNQPNTSFYYKHIENESLEQTNGTIFLKDSFYENLGLPIPNQDSNTVFRHEIFTSNNESTFLNYGNVINMSNVPITSIPHNFLYSAYNHVYNNYYMDENLQLPIAYNMVGFNSNTAISKTDLPNPDTNGKPIFSYGANAGEPIYKMDDINGQEPILPQSPLIAGLQQVNYKKDYFTAMLPFQQRGTSGAIPVNTNYTLDENGFYDIDTSRTKNLTLYSQLPPSDNPNGGTKVHSRDVPVGVNYDSFIFNTYNDGQSFKNDVVYASNIQSGDVFMLGGLVTNNFAQKLRDNTSIGSLSITAPELFLMFALQRWQAVTARAGVRYIEFLQAIYGVSPEPLTLQIPRYLGGTREPIIISDVIQQSQTTTDSELGQTAGYGLLATSDFIESETFYEHGLVMSIFHITYEPSYTQGMPRELTYSSTFDWYAPQFVNLADQAVKKQEVYYGNTAENSNIFGYIGQYDELRTSYNKVAGTLRGNTLGDWVAKREYESNVELNSDFMEVQKGALRDLFQVQDEKPFIVYLQTEVNAIRPLPYHSEPGLISNNYM